MTEIATRGNPPVDAGSALAIRAEQRAFSREQAAALKRMNGWDETPEAELSVFFHQCQRTGLDPFAKQIYLIGRRNNRAGRTDYTIQTSIDGMRLVADRTGRYAGSDKPLFGEDGGDRYAEVTVHKIVGHGRAHTRVPFTGVAYEAEFSQERSPMWRRMPRTMLAKCAEAQALRKAFPADLSGIYGADEMDQAEPVESASVGDPEEAEVERAEVVEASEAPDEVDDLLREIGEAWKALPEDVRPDKAQVLDYAGRSEGHARASLNKLRALAAVEGAAGPTPHPDEVEGVERGGAAPEKPSEGDPATEQQVELLSSLAAEIVEDGDGVAKMEQMLGKPLDDLTRDEAEEWIGRLKGERT